MLFFWFFKNYELIRDSSLWHSNFIPLVRDSIIITRSKCYTYTFGSRFDYKRWVKVFYQKYEFYLSWAIMPILFVGSQSMSIEVHIIWYQSTGSKISFLSLLSFVSCYHLILFLLCSLFLVLILWCALGQNRAPSSQKKKRLQKRNRKQKKILFVVSILSNQNIIFFCLLPLI